MLVCGVFHGKVLLSEGVHTRLEVYLRLIYTVGCIYQLFHGTFKFLNLTAFIALSLSDFVGLPVHKRLKMLLELRVATEALEHPVVGTEVEVMAVHSLIKAWVALKRDFDALYDCIQLVELSLDQLDVFVAKFTQRTTHMAKVMSVEVESGLQAFHKVVTKQLHPPGLVKLLHCVVLVGSAILALSVQSLGQDLQGPVDETRFESILRELVVVVQDVLKWLLGQHECRLHLLDRLRLKSLVALFNGGKLLHLGDEDVVALHLRELILFHMPRDGT